MTTNTAGESAPTRRATTLERFGQIMGGMFSQHSLETGLGIKLRPTDVVITPYSKCGTTWLQQIAHTLRTRGDMDFDDISRVVPWIESSTALGLDINAEQRANPRVFKSHLDAHRIPRGGRYINACRDPRDAAYSMFKFMEGWVLEPGAISPDDFVRGTFVAQGNTPGSSGGDYWNHLVSWWARRKDPDVLFMAYEHMTTDLEATVRRVAAFMGIALDDELLAISLEHASLGFMQQHKDRFDDKMMRDRSVETAGLPANSDSSKVRKGRVGEASEQLGAEVCAELDAIWHRRITRELGFENYAAMIATLQAGG